jgi:hypothetical protein
VGRKALKRRLSRSAVGALMVRIGEPSFEAFVDIRKRFSRKPGEKPAANSFEESFYFSPVM